MWSRLARTIKKPRALIRRWRAPRLLNRPLRRSTDAIQPLQLYFTRRQMEAATFRLHCIAISRGSFPEHRFWFELYLEV